MPKRLIVCADGTWNDEDGADARTNVAKLHTAVQTHYVEGVDQWAYYHSGVGTRWGERLLGGAFGVGISRNIIDCYAFLVDRYEPGDELYLFGFSRGAYTVRSLAGLIRNSGIVRDPTKIKHAFDLYRSRKKADRPGGSGAITFRQKHAKEVAAPVAGDGYEKSPPIHFIGVWDTVGSLGVALPLFSLCKPLLSAIGANWWFHDTDLSTTVKYAYHALAIHERRSDFPPTLWTQQVDAAEKRPDQVLEQVFFPGVHCDVGGGYRGAALSDVAYRWMIEKAAATGLLFRPETGAPGPHWAPDPLGRLHNSFNGAFAFVDALRFRFHGRERTFPSGETYRARIADSAVERLERMPSASWPTRGREHSFRTRIEALRDGRNRPEEASALAVLREPLQGLDEERASA